jgi:hypothetical protein
MGQIAPIDPAWALDRKALSEGWPFRADSALDFERPELNEMRDIWWSLAAGRGVPSRTDFNARRLQPFLRNITIVERVFTEASGWRYRTRLTGAEVAEFVGNHIGKFLEEYLPADAVPRWTATYDAALDGGQPMRLTASFTLPHLDYLTGEAFLAPIADLAGGLTLIIGCIYFKPKHPES